MKHSDNDHIIFREDEDLFSDLKRIQAFFNPGQKTAEGFKSQMSAQQYGQRQKGQDLNSKLTRESMNEKDWIRLFEIHMLEDLVKVK